MNPVENTAEYWIKTLKLTPHPGLETGYLNVVFEDPHKVNGTSGKKRQAGSNIYFLHKPGTKVTFIKDNVIPD